LCETTAWYLDERGKKGRLLSDEASVTDLRI
jgi:hypothetical protein